MAGRGGKRKGAGRKKGGVNKRTRELTEEALSRIGSKIESQGEKLPIEIMYEVMCSYHATWRETESNDAAEKAAYWADKCAPYFHARLSSVTIDQEQGDHEVSVKDHRASKAKD